jgi:DMSO/TMAO reductase YedYZ molybdopterin-dependent catalytic subunit
MALIPSGIVHPNNLLSCPPQTINKTWGFANQDLLTPENKVLMYNNYYEFTDNKNMVKHLAQHLDLSQWTLTIDGLVKQPITLTLPEILD